MSEMAFRPPVELRGRYVEAVPLERAHIPALAEAGRDPEVWRLLRIGPGDTLEGMTKLVDGFLDLQEKGELLPLTARKVEDGTVLGTIRFLDIDRPNFAVEVGTWIGRPWWRTPVNTELKLLAMEHAFEGEGAHRVQLKTDARNERSARAIERLGAVREGVLRDHTLLPDGRLRSSIYYSVLVSEWPAVRERLERFLDRPWDGRPNAPA
jgi:N-acetyltransferase